MADSSPDGTDSVGDPNDDGQLTIRIPNPKVYMARQSQWKGRRGKPRCDHCRMNNLKCDRVLPTCNHCSWASGRECKYTPLPTPAHRGIPRCDRCRLKNLKCDRNLPVCNHCREGDDAECNYTPKKRHKVPSDHGTIKDRQMAPYGAKTASFLVSDMPSMEEQHVFIRSGIKDDSHSFYGQNIASSSRPYGTPPSPTSYDRDRSEDADPSLYPQSSRFTPDYQGRVWVPNSSPHPHLGSRGNQSTNNISFISHSFPSEQGMIITKSRIESWSHTSFAPLPEIVLQRIRTLNSVEMPDRNAFNEAFTTFLGDLSPELSETASFPPAVYADLSRFVSRGDNANLSERLRSWMAYHHVRSGSDKVHLLLIPRDAFFHLEEGEEERLRKDYIARIDNFSRPKGKETFSASSSKDAPLHDANSPDWTTAFERIPVQNQIYDVLVYAHRAHGSSSVMLFEARQIGMATITWPMAEIFIRLCPLCNLRGKSGNSHSAKAEPVYNSYETEGFRR